MNIANATKAWTGHFIYAIYSAARRQHLPCSTRSSYGLTRLRLSTAALPLMLQAPPYTKAPHGEAQGVHAAS